VVDEGRVSRLLRGVSERVQRLDAERDAPRSRQQDALWLDGVKYLFVTAIEGCVDVAQHIGASEGWAAPSDNAEAVRTLGRHAVVDAALADRVARAVGFRNVLVHQYIDVDDARVRQALGELDDLSDFVSEVTRWLLSAAR
jgi:uncharacterized protein YutE (UPF0331/DUF86 family)